jgi:hypothetical protein
MPFFRGFISKACFFCKLLQDISKKGISIHYNKLEEKNEVRLRLRLRLRRKIG